MEFVKPEDIEKRSMQIITSELNGRTWPEPQFSIVKRCIHTSADFDYADNLTFSEDAANIGVQAIRAGADIVTDTKMAAAGINKKKLGAYGGSVHCYISDEDVMAEAKGKVVSREKLMERLWETDSFIDDNTLTVNVNRLRKKLDAAGLPDFIATRFGVGYLIP